VISTWSGLGAMFVLGAVETPQPWRLSATTLAEPTTTKSLFTG
jgi:hypothetical protein